MAVMTDGGLRWVAKAQGSNSMLILDPANGAEPMLHATATGKAWLSTLPEDEVRRILGTGKLAQRTARTKVDPEVVLAGIALGAEARLRDHSGGGRGWHHRNRSADL